MLKIFPCCVNRLPPPPQSFALMIASANGNRPISSPFKAHLILGRIGAPQRSAGLSDGTTSLKWGQRFCLFFSWGSQQQPCAARWSIRLLQRLQSMCAFSPAPFPTTVSLTHTNVLSVLLLSSPSAWSHLHAPFLRFRYLKHYSSLKELAETICCTEKY